MIKGKCRNSDGTEIQHFDFEKMPEFPGGINELIKYLTKNITYPKKARNNGQAGTVYVNFIVDTDGSVANVHVLRGVSESLDEEAVRVVKNYP